MMSHDEIVNWLLEGDVSIRFRVHRDLLHSDCVQLSALQKKIGREGWASIFLARQRDDGHWGRGFYQPKWISTHYTLLDLKELCVDVHTHKIRMVIDTILHENTAEDGGVNPAGTIKESDVCINGMFLNYACYFGTDEDKLKSVADFILSQRLDDGGFNCRLNRSGARHSSLHSTICVAEGIFQYLKQGYTSKSTRLEDAMRSSADFMLRHRLFRSDRTGEIIHRDFLRLTFPCRWRYDIFRALEFFSVSGLAYDGRMDEALDILRSKRNKRGLWKMQAHHPGEVHTVMEKAGTESRWNTLRALKILSWADGNRD